MSIGASSVALYLALALALVFYGLRNPAPTFDRGLIIAVASFFSGIIISSLFSYDPAFSFQRVLTIFTRFIPLFLVVAFVNDGKKLRGILFCLATSVLIADFYALWQWREGVDRVFAFANHPIVFAGLLIMMIPLLIAARHYVSGQSISARAALLAIAALSLAALLLTGTRGAWLALLVMPLIIAVISVRRNAKLGVAAVLIILIFVGVIAGIPRVKDRFISSFDLKANSERLLMWQSAWNMFKDHPLTGVGLGMYQKMEKRKYLSPLAKEPFNRIHAHSNFMNFLGETGLFGFLGFVHLFGYLLYSSYRRYQREPRDIWSLTTLLITAGFLAQGFTEYNFGHLLILRLFTFLIGLTIVGARLPADTVSAPT